MSGPASVVHLDPATVPCGPPLAGDVRERRCTGCGSGGRVGGLRLVGDVHDLACARSRLPDHDGGRLGAHLSRQDARLPDERPRLRAHGRHARAGGLRRGHARAGGGRGRGCHRHQHVRGPRERGGQALRQPGPAGPHQAREARHADRRGRVPRAEGPCGHRRARALGRRGVRHAQPGCAAGPARARAAQRGRPGRDRGVAQGLPLDAAHASRVRVRGLGVDQRRLQQHVHVLHRPAPAGQGARPSAG